MDSESFGTRFGVGGRKRRGKDLSIFSISFNTVHIRCDVKWLATLHLEIYIYNGPKSLFPTLCFYFFPFLIYTHIKIYSSSNLSSPFQIFYQDLSHLPIINSPSDHIMFLSSIKFFSMHPCLLYLIHACFYLPRPKPELPRIVEARI